MNEVVQQQPPQQMAMRTVTERDVNTSGPGPYYVYLPGFTIYDLARMTGSFGSIPAGEVFAINGTRLWTQLSQLPEGAAHRTREIRNMWGVMTDTHGAIDVPAQTVLDTLLADRILTSHGLTVLNGLETIDIQIVAFNQLIQPVAIPERTFPAEFRAILSEPGKGMLYLRRVWLQKAAEQLETGQMLEDIRRVVSAHPFVREVWHRAIMQDLIPSVDRFEETANSILAKKEEAVRDGEKKGYDIYDNTLMWLLGRKPERTALSRTLEGVNKGIGIEEIRTLVQEIVIGTAASNGVAPVAERVQCPECGEFLNTIGGGPPRKCRHCNFEFRPASVEEQPAPITAASVESAEIVSKNETDSNGDSGVGSVAQQLAKKIRRS